MTAGDLNNAEIWFLAAEFHLQAARLADPDTFGRWTKFEDALNKGLAAKPDSALGSLLEGARAIVEEKPDVAMRHLRAAEAKAPEDAGFWQRLCVIYQDLNRPVDADRALAEFAKRDLTGWRPLMLKARLLASRDDLPAAISTAKEAVEVVRANSIDELAIAQRLLFDLHVMAGDDDTARQLLISMHASDEDNMALLRELAEFDLARNELEGVVPVV